MPLKRSKPTTPGRRFYIGVSNEDITRDKPEKSLTKIRKRTAGRNNTGRITVRHHGGGHKKRLRIVDYKRDLDGIAGKIASIEYDPNRSSRIALVHYTNGVKKYIIATKNMKVGDRIISGPQAELSEGNALTLSEIPLGAIIHNIEFRPDSGGKAARSAGIYATLLAKEGGYAHVRMPSGEVRLFNIKCRATVGQVGNEEHNLQSYGKAGRKRWMGIRPTVRGTAMNPCDHPHGGGEGKNKTAGRHPMSPWGVLAKGGKTRSKRKSDKLIVTARKRKKR